MPKLDDIMNKHYGEVEDETLPNAFNEAILNRISEKSKSFKYLLDIIAASIAIFLISSIFFDFGIATTNSENSVLKITNDFTVILLQNQVVLYSVVAFYAMLYLEQLVKNKMSNV